MEHDNKQFLVSMMNLSTKLRKNDPTVMAEVAFLNSFEKEEDQKQQIFDIISQLMDVRSEIDNKLMMQVVSELDVIDKDYLKLSLEMPTDVSTPEAVEQVKKYLGVMLSKDIGISNGRREFTFYSRCVYLAIMTNDSQLIEQAVRKVESL